MRGLSLTQPWASLVAVGAKRYETRSWGTSYRGPILIHAAKGFPTSCRSQCELGPFLEALKNRPESGARFAVSNPEHWYHVASTRYVGGLPLGAVVAIARLVNVQPTERYEDDEEFEKTDEYAFGDYSAGRFAWCLADVRMLHAPVPWKGALGLWAVPEELRRRVDEQLRGVGQPQDEN